MADKRHFKCYDCSQEWEVAYGTGQSGKQMQCPKCGSSNIHRTDAGGPGPGRGRGGPGRGLGAKK
jgi:DNA-directed RNA polymerase subunit RPC12/RpoP